MSGFTCRHAVVLEHLTEYQLVWVFAEGVTEHGSRDEIHVAVGAFGLVSAGPVKVPFGKF